MSKTLKKNVFTAVATMSMLTSLVAGCGKNKVETIEVQNGTLQRNFVVGDDVDKVFDDLKLVVKYSDGSTKTLTKNDVEIITDFTTATAGKYPVKIKYDGKEIVVNLRVVSDATDLSTIVSINLPDSISTRINAMKEKDNKEEEFYDRDNVYVVGDDNAFRFFPRVGFDDEENDSVGYLSAYKSVSKIELKKNDGTFEELTGAALTAMVAINETESTYKFTDDAVGKEFKLTVRPNCDIYTCYPSVGSVSTTFKVVDGYNVTDAKELLLMVNDHAEDGDFDRGGGYQSSVNEVLRNNGIVKPDDPLSSLVLQNDIKITNDDLPTDFFFDNTGHLMDYNDIYTLKLKGNQEFNIYGNYFTLDASEISKVNTETAQDNVSHSSLIKVHSLEDGAKFNVYDLKTKGNGHRENNASGFGGLIFTKNQTVTGTYDNVIIRSYYINNYAEMRSNDVHVNSTLNLNHVKSYEPYQNFVLAWGANNINITESEFKRAGGPAMILQHKVVTEQFDNFVPFTTLENVVIEDKLLGNEAWFSTLPGLSGIAGYVKSLNKLISDAAPDGITASFTDDKNMIEIIAVNMSNGMSPTGTKAQGMLTIDSTIVANLMNSLQYQVSNGQVTIDGVTYNVTVDEGNVTLSQATSVFVPTTTVDYTYDNEGKITEEKSSTNELMQLNGSTYTHMEVNEMDLIVGVDSSFNPMTDRVYAIQEIGGVTAPHRVSYALANKEIEYDNPITQKKEKFTIKVFIDNPAAVLLGGAPNPVAVFDEEENKLYSISSQNDIEAYAQYRIKKYIWDSLNQEGKGALLISNSVVTSEQWAGMDDATKQAVIAQADPTFRTSPLENAYSLTYYIDNGNYVLLNGQTPAFAGMLVEDQIIYVDLNPAINGVKYVVAKVHEMTALVEAERTYAVTTNNQVTLLGTTYTYNADTQVFANNNSNDTSAGYKLYNDLNRSVPVFESSNGGIMHVNADSTALVNPFTEEADKKENARKFFSGDYVTLYYMGMAITLKYNVKAVTNN